MYCAAHRVLYHSHLRSPHLSIATVRFLCCSVVVYLLPHRLIRLNTVMGRRKIDIAYIANDRVRKASAVACFDDYFTCSWSESFGAPLQSTPHPCDRFVLQVTLCKRRGGLFKKANDLSKLCGVEIAVLVLQDKKTSEFVSTDLSRILHLSRDMQSGGTGKDASETAQLWEHLESQRRELEALRREVAAEVSSIMSAIWQTYFTCFRVSSVAPVSCASF